VGCVMDIAAPAVLPGATRDGPHVERAQSTSWKCACCCTTSCWMTSSGHSARPKPPSGGASLCGGLFASACVCVAFGRSKLGPSRVNVYLLLSHTIRTFWPCTNVGITWPASRPHGWWSAGSFSTCTGLVSITNDTIRSRSTQTPGCSPLLHRSNEGQAICCGTLRDDPLPITSLCSPGFPQAGPRTKANQAPPSNRPFCGNSGTFFGELRGGGNHLSRCPPLVGRVFAVYGVRTCTVRTWRCCLGWLRCCFSSLGESAPR
jgi:hypothetical protein